MVRQDRNFESFSRCREQVDVAGHPDLRVYPASPTMRGLLEPAEARSVAEVLKRDGLPVVAALDDVQGNTWTEDSRPGGIGPASADCFRSSAASRRVPFADPFYGFDALKDR